MENNLEVYKCDFCGRNMVDFYNIDIRISNEDSLHDYGGREILQNVCKKCYWDWYKGRISTAEFIGRCQKNINKNRS